jgi:endogenous inhibitor of DNA gyrase (YacG/DUF329 family)
MSEKQIPLRVVRIVPKCPICSKDAVEQKYRPFCCKRCADIDLGRWLKEGYRVPTDEGPSDDLAEESGSRARSEQEGS